KIQTMASERMYGVTPPMKEDLPTQPELAATESLIDELKRQNTFESPSDTDKRYKVLASLAEICNEFVKHVARLREPKNEVLIRNAIGRVFTYGSFRLGVYGPGSDIDTLVVAPRYVTRDDYFEHFPGLLVDMAPKGAITDMAVVTDAFVPIIKFEYFGISIDLIFSRIMQKQLSTDLEDLRDSGLLRGLDEAELRSLNGTRVTDEILNLVPEKGTFRMALRAIKLWAQRRAVYANIMGFPGGVAWAMLVARVCQLYPKATASVVVNKFFLIILKWQWPQPVLLKPIESGPLPVRVWNPKLYKGDAFHLMPVITPAYPSMCATFNITKSSMTVIQRELKRAFEISEKIMTGKVPWAELFNKHTFFTAGFKYYISVISTSTTKEAHKIWSGYVESKVRMLVQRLETHPSIALARAFNKGYERKHLCRNNEEIAKVQEGVLDFLVPADEGKTNEAAQQPQNGDASPPQHIPGIKAEGGVLVKNEPGLDDTAMPSPQQALKSENNGAVKAEDGVKTEDDVKDGITEVYTTTHYIGLELNKDAKSLDLSYQVDEFKSLCTSWVKYKDELQDVATIGVQHCRNINLPDDVFEPGETKPQKKSAAKAVANGKKRGASEVIDPPCPEQGPSPPPKRVALPDKR
ncbi:unnamed protein product, partial [Clonostachys byssicola]